MASDLGLSCPRGGEWYICQGTKIEFVGCCTIDPCADGSGECAEANLLPASFSMNQYSKIPSLGCAPSTKPGYKQPLWWTCIAPVPPFMGCCHSNPCTDGCPEGNLSAARLPYEPSTREMFLTNANANVEPEKSSKLSSGAIAGIVVGAIAVIVALIGAYWFLRRKKQKKTAVENVPQTTDANGIQVSSYNKDSPNPNYSPHPSAVSPHSGYGYPNTPPQAHGFQTGYQNGYQTVPSELGSPYVAELSGNHQGEVAMLDSTPVGHHQTHSPTIPPSESTVTSGWPTDKK